MDMLHSDFSLAFAAVAVEGFKERSIGAGKLIHLGKVFLGGLRRSARQSWHAGSTPSPCCGRRSVAPPSCPPTRSFAPMPIGASRAALNCLSRVSGAAIHPKPLHGLEGKNVVPVIGTRAADMLKRSHQIASIVGDHRRWLGRVRSLLSRHAAPCRFHLPAHCPSKHAIHVTFPREELPCERYW
jgi:hypothetical protein